MVLVEGISYNFRGLGMGVKTPKLLLLGLIRIAVVILLTVVAALLIYYNFQVLIKYIWAKPESNWVVWLWYVFTWLAFLVFVGISVVLAYLVSQIIFSVIIMDQMSRITEKMISGRVSEPQRLPFWKQLFFLIKQEIPRAVLPVLIMLLLTIAGWLTPFGPIVAIITTGAAITFLAWDNTDLTPARRMQPFKERFKRLTGALPFHLGFGLPFLIPILNIVLLSFAPVGATLYYLEKQEPNRSHHA
jgi:CysZ protein